MFTYVHVRPDLSWREVFNGGGVSQTVQTRVAGNIAYDEATYNGANSGQTFGILYTVTTYPDSVTTIIVSNYETYTDTDSTNNYIINTTFADNYVLFQSSGVNSYTFTAQPTRTASFTTMWYSNSTTTLSGSASQTEQYAGTPARTLTISSVTTRVNAPIPVLNEMRTYVQRPLPFLRMDVAGISYTSLFRGVNRAFGAGEIGGTTGFRTLTTLPTGDQTYNSTRLTATSRTSSTGNTDGTTSYTTDWVRNTVYLKTDMGYGEARARRRRYFGSVFFGTEGTSGNAMVWDAFGQLLSPTIDPAFNEFTSIASNIFLRRIFTKTERSIYSSHYSIAGSSAYLCWSYLSSSWKLFATKTNSTTSTTLEISLLTSSSAQTTTGNAIVNIGLVINSNSPATFILGPLVPFSTLSFNEISVSKSATFNSTRPFVLLEGYGTSTTPSATSSSSYAVSTSFTFSNGTANSNLPTYASSLAISVSTSTEDLFGQSNDFGIYAANSKFNEAGRKDYVSVIE